MPEWTVQFVEFNGVMTMTVIDPTGEVVGQWKTPDAESAGKVFAEAITKQSFETHQMPWEAIP